MFGKILITKDEKKGFDQAVQGSYLWSNNEKIIALGSNSDFVIELFEQNLAHARHVENERLTYCACFTALIGGGLAVLSSLKGSPVSIVLSLVLFLLSILSYFLNERWGNAFDRHITYAKGCYYILHCNAQLNNMSSLKNVFHKKKRLKQLQEKEALDQRHFIKTCCNECDKCDKRSKCNKCKEVFELEGSGKKLRLDTLPLYCFGINNPIIEFPKKGCFWADTRSTKQYFKRYYRWVCILIFLVMVYMWCSSWPTLKKELSAILNI